MKNRILIFLLLAIGSLYAQDQPRLSVKVNAVKFRTVTTEIRDLYVVPVGEEWLIKNTTTNQFEFWDGDSWEVLGGLSAADQAKLDNITVSGPVNLDNVFTNPATGVLNMAGYAIENLPGLSVSGAIDGGSINAGLLNVNGASTFSEASTFNNAFNLPYLSNPPTIDIRNGSEYIDSDDNLKYRYNGVIWVPTGNGNGDFMASGVNPMTGNLDLNSQNILNGGTGDFVLINSTAITLGNGASNPTININGTSGNFPFIFTPTEITYGGVPVLNPTAGRVNTSSLTAVNYTPTTTTVLTGHLSGIDTKLGELENDPITQTTFNGDITLSHDNAWNVGNYNRLKSNSTTNVSLLPPTDGLVGDSWEIVQVGDGQVQPTFKDEILSANAGTDIFLRTRGPGAIMRITRTPLGYDIQRDIEVFNPTNNLYTQATAANPTNEINSTVGVLPQTGITVTSVDTSPNAQNGTYSLVFERTAGTGTTIRPIIPLGDLGNGSSFIVSLYVQEVQGTDFQVQLSTSHGWVTSEALVTTSGGWTLYTFASNTVDTNDPRIRINFLSTTAAGDKLAIDNIVVTAN